MADEIKPVEKPVEQATEAGVEPVGGYTFPDEPAAPRHKTSSGVKVVAALVVAILLGEAAAFSYRNGYLPALPSVSWPERKVVETAPKAPEKAVDERARLVEAMSEYIRVTRQAAFEKAKAAPNQAEVAKLEKERDELKIEIRALASKRPIAELPPEMQRFIQGM